MFFIQGTSRKKIPIASKKKTYLIHEKMFLDNRSLSKKDNESNKTVNHRVKI